MARRLGPTTTRYYHHSGPQRDDDETDDGTFDYEYYETYDDYSKSRAAREPRSRAGPGGRGISDGHSPLHHSANDEDHDDNADADRDHARRQRRRRSGGGLDDPRTTRSRDIHLHSPRLAAAAAGSYFSARNGRGRQDQQGRDDGASSRKPRSIPGGDADVSKAGPTYETPRGRPPLPPGWLPLFSTTHGRWYYVNKDSGKPQWEAPGFEVKTLQKEQRQREREGERERGRERADKPTQRGRDAGQRGLAPRDVSPSDRSARSHSGHSRRSSNLSITGMLLGAAGGIAAGALVAKALKKDGSERSIKRHSSHSDTLATADRRRDRDRDGRRNDKDDFEEDNVPSYHHSHGGSHHHSHGDDHGHGGGHGHGHGDDDDDDDD
ncbi:uncharacterized protein SPSK_09349 [Sporothrix schenckii 1099-18]|uniref:WW domain-containing protein n=1 Tax=Sporothrix schenckii 1099-18 TaxID=1397361 RepID=A0A0F2M533_SPOSC|nr:uncharacterized protein SPSK_09349 [Sporothrix schenckii 1099-18]KJR84204.1 hypothetical protein SPSK_09349 [Sporothrix schenckii 1099-18]